jgi:hypothetical protein
MELESVSESVSPLASPSRFTVSTPLTNRCPTSIPTMWLLEEKVCPLDMKL